MTQASKLRALMQGDAIVPLAGTYDALSARLAQRAGLPVAYVSGYCVSAALLGQPDVGYLTLPEIVGVARSITAQVDIPIICDGDDGYGNHLNTGRLVRELERVGVAGVQMEDQVSPKRCGHMRGKRVVPARDMVAKIRAAVDTRRDADFVVIARTDAIAVEGFEAAMERAHAYSEAGADVIFLEAPETLEQARAVPAAFAQPTVFNWAYGGRSPLPTTEEVKAMGYKFLLCPDTIFAVTRTLLEVYGEVARTGTYAAVTDRMSSFDEFNDLIGLAGVAELDRRYGPPQP
ncbi:carboxyvinyl-carboxyphosphonate phosphorylmutase [Xylophilus rhododendri]|uniref:Carboxyvinyl-carboxyphosphonate phosphorylmutase n=1 Tax=Xylophilus rhododendri TaxID=2697032 RepID=A0A857J9C1_9BURK|nr:oxaloacetate decarboxylase [Xylophilus rhododendri]QHI99649.1 carboxyvinyl-carboxyphosphonate phosphorylmutase [Xylophilus rhododendri]